MPTPHRYVADKELGFASDLAQSFVLDMRQFQLRRGERRPVFAV